MKFELTPLGQHAIKKKDSSNFIDSFNNFWMWQYDIKLWSLMGKPNPFDDSDISIVQFFKANLNV